MPPVYNRCTAVFVAKMAERAERYHDMVDAMKVVARMNEELTAEERRLLSAGFKHAVTARRASWRALSEMEKEEEDNGNHTNLWRVKMYIQKVEKEIHSICVGVQALLDAHVIPFCSSNSQQDLVYYYKMVGDYIKICAEYKTGEDKQKYANQSLTVYEKASKIAERVLLPSNALRLGLALNLAVFYYEIAVLPKRAIEIARKALDDAIEDYQTMTSESLDIMAKLGDNILLWTPTSGAGTSGGVNDGDWR